MIWLGVLGLITFIASWNNFFGALVVLRTSDMYTLPLALRNTAWSVWKTPPKVLSRVHSICFCAHRCTWLAR